jgi:peptide/nickel transport system permease protein
VRALGRILGGAVATFLVASFVIYFALGLAPGDPATALAGNRATPETIAHVRHEYGLDRPLPVRYVSWLGDALHGDFGQSFQFHQSVSSVLAPSVGVTLWLVVYASLLILLVGIGAGLLPSFIRRSNIVVTILASVGIAIPTFVAAMILIQVFALNLEWFPTTGSGSGSFGQRVWHLTLPAIALALSWSAYVAQITRASVREQERLEHVDTARGRGLSSVMVFRRHVLRNAAVPIVTISGLTVAGLIAGSIVVETAFNLGGMGSLLVKSVSAKDYNVVLAISLILVAAFVIANTVADLAQLALDPRVRAKGAP